MSSSLNSKSNTSAFSLIREGVTDFGRGTKPYTVSSRSPRLLRGTYLLQTPPNQHLRRCLAILPPQLFQHRLVGLGIPHKRRISLYHSPSLLQPVHNIRPRQPRMQLILPDIDLAAATGRNILLKLVEMVHSVIRDADRAGFTGLLCFNERFPRAESAFFSTVGSMD